MNSPPVFWALALLLLALTLAVLVWPLVRRRTREGPSAERARAAVYHDQKRQLDDERAAGAMSSADHAAALRELTQRLGAELEAPREDVAATRGERLAWLSALATIAIIPAGAIALYLVFGTPDALPISAQARPNDAQIVAMVDKLAAKMKANPGDPRGWLLLGRSEVALGRYTEAANSFAQAVQHGRDDADVYADWSEALALAHDRVVSGEPEALAQRALAKDPAHGKALALLATAALERRDFDASLGYWRRVAQGAPTGSEDAAQAAAAIAEVERIRADASTDASKGNAPGAPASASSPPASASASAPPASTPSTSAPAASPPSASPPSASPPPASASSAASVSGRIQVAPELAGRISPGDTLFVYARAPGGPRMPLAVSRSRAAGFPADFRLDDTMGMGTGAALSSASSVVVEARISKSGDARPHPGDLTGESAAVKPGAHDVHIVIDRVVP
jgi:cytochrome c-type biogenesis protein CcmH